MASWYRREGNSLYLQLHVRPGAKKNEYAGLHGDRLKLKIHAPPVDGKANAELVEFISQQFNIGKSSITLLHGTQGRDKTLRIVDAMQIPPELRALGLR